jgi:RNA polymerase sigma factor (sigma-70 family)
MPLPEDREALVIAHIWLVKSIAKKICNLFDCHEIFEDLVQEGTIGLIRALNRYNPDIKVKVATYAYRWIRGTMFNYLNKNRKYGIRISRLLHKRARTIVVVQDELMRKHNRKPTTEEIAETAGMSIIEVEEGLDLIAMSMVDLADIKEGGERAFPLTPHEPSAEQSIVLQSQIESVLSMLERLSPGRRKALMLRYFEDLSNREIAEKMNKTEGAVKVLIHRALEDLRKIHGSCFDCQDPQIINHNGSDGGNAHVGGQ